MAACGLRHAVAVTANGEIWAWGSNDHGQLGLGFREARLSPHRIDMSGSHVLAAAVSQ